MGRGSAVIEKGETTVSGCKKERDPAENGCPADERSAGSDADDEVFG